MGGGLEHGPVGVEAVSGPAGSKRAAAVIEMLMREVPDFPEPGMPTSQTWPAR